MGRNHYLGAGVAHPHGDAAQGVRGDFVGVGPGRFRVIPADLRLVSGHARNPRRLFHELIQVDCHCVTSFLRRHYTPSDEFSQHNEYTMSYISKKMDKIHCLF